jgi:hypothetical protein
MLPWRDTCGRATPESRPPGVTLSDTCAFAPIAATLLDPFQAAIGIGRLVGLVRVHQHPHVAAGAPAMAGKTHCKGSPRLDPARARSGDVD